MHLLIIFVCAVVGAVGYRAERAHRMSPKAGCAALEQELTAIGYPAQSS